MAEYKLSLEKRELTGKKLKSLREKGLIPSVLYGGKEPILLASEYVATEKVLEKAGYHSPIDLDVAGKKKMAIVKNIHIDPVSRRVLNIEFQAISANEVVEATTPIVIVNFEASEASKTYPIKSTSGLSSKSPQTETWTGNVPLLNTGLETSSTTSMEDQSKNATSTTNTGIKSVGKNTPN
jgi:large subunit ribosomal protein L25